MTSGTTYRKPTEWEERLIARLLGLAFPGRDGIAEQVRDCLVETIDQEGSLRFHIGTGTLAPVEKRVPVEAEAKDTDGQTIHALLHVARGRVVELEIYKEDGSPVRRPPDPQDWEVFVLPAGRSGGRPRTGPS